MADTPYTSQSISGFNANPPADDGSQVAANRVEWAKHLDKIGTPLKTLIEAINSQNVTAFQSLADLHENINAEMILAREVFSYS